MYLVLSLVAVSIRSSVLFKSEIWILRIYKARFGNNHLTEPDGCRPREFGVDVQRQVRLPDDGEGPV